MNFLFICHKPPLAAADGGSIATSGLIDGLRSCGHQVELMTVETDRHPSRLTGDTQTGLARALRYEAFPVDTRVTPVRALRGLFQDCYHVDRFDGPAGHTAISNRLRARSFDVVVLESLYVVPYLGTVRRHSDATVIIRTQNVEHHIWERQAATATLPRSWYLRQLARQLRRYETRMLPLADGVTAISPDDQTELARLLPGIEVGLVEVAMPGRRPLGPILPGAPLCSIASYDWAPNVDGMRWFLDEVWPDIRRARPDARLDIAGWHSDRLAATFTRPGVQVLGPVDSADDFLAERGVVVAPVRSGSGVRVKLVEAMLSAKPIVTTPIGALGLSDDRDWPLRIRDDSAGFAEATVGLLADTEAANALGAAARSEAERRFSTERITTAFLEVVDKARSRAGARNRAR